MEKKVLLLWCCYFLFYWNLHTTEINTKILMRTGRYAKCQLIWVHQKFTSQTHWFHRQDALKNDKILLHNFIYHKKCEREGKKSCTFAHITNTDTLVSVCTIAQEENSYWIIEFIRMNESRERGAAVAATASYDNSCSNSTSNNTQR